MIFIRVILSIAVSSLTFYNLSYATEKAVENKPVPKIKRGKKPEPSEIIEKSKASKEDIKEYLELDKIVESVDGEVKLVVGMLDLPKECERRILYSTSKTVEGEDFCIKNGNLIMLEKYKVLAIRWRSPPPPKLVCIRTLPKNCYRKRPTQP